MIHLPETHRVLVVDDDLDVHSLTRLSLRGIQFNSHGIELHKATSGQEALDYMKDHPDTSVVLMDVVMETDSAGLDACNAIRGELGNHLTRIILRTGQPGIAPEKEVIEHYDIDGYLLKTELTTTRLYAAVRTALKAYEELVALQRHRELLGMMNRIAADLHAFDDVEFAMRKLVTGVSVMLESSAVVLHLTTLETQGNPKVITLNLPDDDNSDGRTTALVERVRSADDFNGPQTWENGLLIPFKLYRNIGHGWIFVENPVQDRVLDQLLPMIASHAGNAFYASVAQQLLEDRDGPFYDSIGV